MSKAFIRHSVTPDLTYQEKIARRIDAIRRWKFENHGKTLPDHISIDELAPGTDDIGCGDDVSDSEIARRRKAREKGHKPFRLRYGDEAAFRMKRLIGFKTRNGGTIGLHMSGDLTCKVTYAGRYVKHVKTFAKGAAIYNEIARKIEGDLAVLNDPEAVAERDRQRLELIEEKRLGYKLRKKRGVR